MDKWEEDLVYHGIGEYKGWRCSEIGDGTSVWRKNNEQFSTSSSGEKWVANCWNEAKGKIEKLETA